VAIVSKLNSVVSKISGSGLKVTVVPVVLDLPMTLSSLAVLPRS